MRAMILAAAMAMAGGAEAAVIRLGPVLEYRFEYRFLSTFATTFELSFSYGRLDPAPFVGTIYQDQPYVADGPADTRDLYLFGDYATNEYAETFGSLSFDATGEVEDWNVCTGDFFSPDYYCTRSLAGVGTDSIYNGVDRELTFYPVGSWALTRSTFCLTDPVTGECVARPPAPVPLPASASLIATALAGLFGLRRLTRRA